MTPLLTFPTSAAPHLPTPTPVLGLNPAFSATLTTTATTMSATSTAAGTPLDTLFKQKKTLRSKVKKKLYVPRVEDKNSFMRMLNISRIDDLIANSMDILEPAPCDAEGNEREDVMFANEPVDLFLLPGLAFDKSGRRLGRGGGYYDTLLTKYQELAKDRKWKKPLFVALSYSVQILEDGVIPVTPNDVPVDAVVLSSGIIPITPAAVEICS
ncbi:UNVERIFIED_CONTAM: 5-formyltetrahydrofolate cyclo-ligase, mitochondrial [Sesamum calycinum]|uniref:5-formyltetrahydrofolate cyclo-ligase n=1 Tax=Sesamum calycinum TaxID=2727403 RepID=A0AAW2NG67_9LAMI